MWDDMATHLHNIEDQLGESVPSALPEETSAVPVEKSTLPEFAGDQVDLCGFMPNGVFSFGSDERLQLSPEGFQSDDGSSESECEGVLSPEDLDAMNSGDPIRQQEGVQRILARSAASQLGTIPRAAEEYFIGSDSSDAESLEIL